MAEMGGVQEALSRIASEAFIVTSAQHLVCFETLIIIILCHIYIF